MRLALTAMALVLAGCASPVPRRGGAGSPSSAAPCREGSVPLLDACVAPAVGDAWCGAAARMSSSGGCAFRECAADEALDLDGSCVPIGGIVRTGPACPAGGSLVVASRHTACIPADDACPRGRHLQAGRCTSPRPPRLDASDPVDIAAWAARVLGPSGGPGAPETCRPLAQRPDLFGLTPGQALTVHVAVRILVPDEDLSRVYAEVRTRPSPPPAAESLVREAVSSSLAALRSRAAQASAGVVDEDIACTIESL